MNNITRGMARMSAGAAPEGVSNAGDGKANGGGGGGGGGNRGGDGGGDDDDDYSSDGSYASGSYDSRSYSYSSSRSYDSRSGDDEDAYSRSYSDSYSDSGSYSRSYSDGDSYSGTGSDLSGVAKSSSASTDSQATASASSVYSEEDEAFIFAGKTGALDIAQLGDVSTTAIEAGPEAIPLAFDMFMGDVCLIRGDDAFETQHERELFKKAFVKQIVFKEAEIVFKEMQSWDEESRESKGQGYFVYFVIRGALAATKLVHPRYAAVHTPEAMAHLDDPMSILKPIRMQTPMIFQDAQFETDVDRQRAKDMLKADDFSSVELAKFIRGSCFGEFEVLEGRIPRQYTITSLVSNTAVAVMHAHVFEKFARQGSELRRRIDAERASNIVRF